MATTWWKLSSSLKPYSAIQSSTLKALKHGSVCHQFAFLSERLSWMAGMLSTTATGLLPTANWISTKLLLMIAKRLLRLIHSTVKHTAVWGNFYYLFVYWLLFLILLFFLRLAYASLNQHVDAVRCYEKAVQLEPENESYLSNLQIAEEKMRQMSSGGAEGMGASGLNIPGLDVGAMLNNPGKLLIYMKESFPFYLFWYVF